MDYNTTCVSNSHIVNNVNNKKMVNYLKKYNLIGQGKLNFSYMFVVRSLHVLIMGMNIRVIWGF